MRGTGKCSSEGGMGSEFYGVCDVGSSGVYDAGGREASSGEALVCYYVKVAEGAESFGKVASVDASSAGCKASVASDYSA